MLQFIGGLGPRKAGVVQRAIQTAGRLRTRKDLFMTLKVMGKKVFINSAGFIRVCGSGEAASETQDLNPLDDTRIHPESYQVSFSSLLTHAIQSAFILMQSKSQDTFLDQLYFTIRNGLVSNPYSYSEEAKVS